MPKTRSDARLREGETCWRIERADKLSLIVDAADYFLYLRKALTNAKEAVYLIGWDFDLRIQMVPGEEDEDGNAPDGWPNRLGDFLQAVVKANGGVDLYILKWDGAMLSALAQQAWPTLQLKMASDRIHFALDSHHPVGACHHQKIVVVDDRLAFCGGIDVTTGRWDTREHAPQDERRSNPDGSLHQPWHDVSAAIQGDAAKALGELARNRWQLATGEELGEPATSSSPWPKGLDADWTKIDLAIARTAPRYDGSDLVNEIEEQYLAAIASAKRSIYIESQYLAGGTICQAMQDRLEEDDGPEIVVVNPMEAQDFIENEAMHSVRSRMIERLREVDDGKGRFAIYYPVNAAEEDIYVHAKVMVVDGEFLRVGSSNIDNRSMGYDTECDIAFEAKTKNQRDRIDQFVCSLLAEHLDRDREEVADAIEQRGSIIEAINALNSDEGRGLRTVEAEDLDPFEKALADSRLFDPRYWPRERTRPVEGVKHAAKKAMAPYHMEAVGGGSALLGVLGLAAGVWLGANLVRRYRDRQRGEFPAPGFVTHRRVRPPARRARRS